MGNKWKISEVILSLFFFIMLIFTFLGVIMRYVFNKPLLFSEELARIILILIVLIGATINSRDKNQLRVTFFTKFLSKKVNKELNLIINIIIVLSLSALTYYGVLLAFIAERQYTNVMKIPWPVVYLIVPFSSIIILLYHLKDILNFFKGQSENQRERKI